MTTKNMAYDHPAYTARVQHAFTPAAAGANAVSPKFVAFSNLQLFSLTGVLATQGGTSTYTLWNGTATCTAVGAQSFSLVRIFNTAAAGSAPALGTATFGPFVISNYNGTATGTQTNSTAAGLAVNVPLYAAPGTNAAGQLVAGTATGQVQAGAASSQGGVWVNQGDQLYVVTGTEATAVGAFALEYGILPLSNVTQ